jgi:type VI secretion system protein ImpK
MSSDNKDKTVFRPPSVNSDRTVIRPMPGGRSGRQQQQAPEQPVQQPPPLQSQPPTQTVPPIQSPPPVQQRPAAVSQYQPELQTQIDSASGSAYFNTSSGLNPLINAASTLIAVFEKTRQSLSHPDVGGLHQRLCDEIKLFEKKVSETGIRPEIALSARYSICAALDEIVLNTPWGSESAWPQRTLLSIFHNETSGGEKFFQLLDRMLEQPAENLYILELMYVLLSLGFEGKYRVIHRGRDAIEQLRDELFTTIRRQRGDYERSLSPSWQGLGKSRNSLAHYLPVWVAASILAVVLLLGYSGFRVWLYDSSLPVIEKLDEIADMRTIANKNSNQ